MSRTSFRYVRTGVPSSVRKFAAGVLMMGLALSASARDGSPSGTTQPSSAKSKHWFQVGMASWYGPRFQGHRTAGGEPFDMNLMTCAHRSLPMGTWLRVTNLKNSRTAFVRVNDRGPVLGGRIVDLSFAAARALGLASLGRVKLEPVSESDPDLAQALVTQLQMPAMFSSAGL